MMICEAITTSFEVHTTWAGTVQRNCNWVRKQKTKFRCTLSNVSEFCPKTCYPECAPPTTSPSSVPSQSPSLSSGPSTIPPFNPTIHQLSLVLTTISKRPSFQPTLNDNTVSNDSNTTITDGIIVVVV